MKIRTDNPATHDRTQWLVEGAAFLSAAVLVASSAMLVKQGRLGLPLASVESAPRLIDGASRLSDPLAEPHDGGELFAEWVNADVPAREPKPRSGAARESASRQAGAAATHTARPSGETDQKPQRSALSEAPRRRGLSTDLFTPPEGYARYFDGKPIVKSRTITMTVTAYSPDWRSCGDSADGYTATNHSVWTNGMRLVAADPKVLPMGSMISVPGYANGLVVPVLDVGGAIKGNRLDVLFATHEEARRWGVKNIKVTVWEFADGTRRMALR